MRKLLILACLAALFVIPGIAQAGCQAYPDVSWVDSPRMYSIAAVGCTTNNGSLYQVRSYLQANSGGWHSTNLDAPKYRSISNPGSNYYTEWVIDWSVCDQLVTADTQIRLKEVLENMTTHTVDTRYGGSYTLPASCK